MAFFVGVFWLFRMSSDEELVTDQQPPPGGRLLSPLPPLFGLLTPLGGAEDFSIMHGVASPDEPTDANEQVFIPHQTPLRRSGAAYSPLPDDLAPLEPAQSLGLKRKRSSQKSSRKKKKKKALKKRMSKTVLSPDNDCVILRTKRQYTLPAIDPYYAHRYERVAEIDERLAKILTVLGPDFFAHKSVLDIACGRCAFVSFYIAAYLGASRVVVCDSEFESVMSNLRQLRKFKHDGIRLETSSGPASDNYPPILVKRSGPVPITNKPWRVLPQYSYTKEPSKILNENFPFNIEFRLANAMSNEWTQHHQFDIIIVLGYIMKHAFITGGKAGIRTLFQNIALSSDTKILVEIFYWRDVRKHMDNDAAEQIRVDRFLTDELGLTIERRIGATLLLMKFPPSNDNLLGG